MMTTRFLLEQTSRQVNQFLLGTMYFESVWSNSRTRDENNALIERVKKNNTPFLIKNIKIQQELFTQYGGEWETENLNQFYGLEDVPDDTTIVNASELTKIDQLEKSKTPFLLQTPHITYSLCYHLNGELQISELTYLSQSEIDLLNNIDFNTNSISKEELGAVLFGKLNSVLPAAEVAQLEIDPPEKEFEIDGTSESENEKDDFEEKPAEKIRKKTLKEIEDDDEFTEAVDEKLRNWQSGPTTLFLDYLLNDKEKELFEALQKVKLDDFIQTEMRLNHLHKLFEKYPELGQEKKNNYLIGIGLTDPIYQFISLYASYFYSDGIENNCLEKFRMILSKNISEIDLTKFFLLDELFSDSQITGNPIIQSIQDTVKGIKNNHTNKELFYDNELSIQKAVHYEAFREKEIEKAKNKTYHSKASAFDKLSTDFETRYRTIEDLDNEFNDKIIKNKISFVPLLFQLSEKEKLLIKEMKAQYVFSLERQCEIEKNQILKNGIKDRAMTSMLVNCHRDFGFFGLRKTKTLETVEEVLKQRGLNPESK